ncbi:hypothetical protein [Paenibacillus wenxiniae]|uniref:Uncharacterized protein n=1 Tax=Paenibacillus wenxiniae TaxID=1636843 RepID=A0ABW4RM12_9BACL
MSLEQIKNMMKTHVFDDICLVGFVYAEENELTEFIASMRCLFLEFGNKIIKVEEMEQFSKLSLTVVDDIHIDIDVENFIPAKSRISNVVFHNPLSDNIVSEIVLFNMEEHEARVICDVFKLVLLNKQELFFDPSFLGINVGGSEVEALWRNNQLKGYKAIPTVIKL